MNDSKQIHKALPLRLSASLIAKFQKKYFETFAEKISPDAAEVELLGLAELIRITTRIQHVNENNMKEGEENEK
jgi:hypothetical protein